MSTVQGEPITATAEHEVAGRSLNQWGMIFFITSEALIFANLIAAYLYLEIRSGTTWRLPSEIVFPAINTVILLSSSGTAWIASRGMSTGNRRNFLIGMIGTIIL